ncbi:hypothetical protein SEUCBS140593_009748 [Sporothrix eucalyptigena]|uniref:BZIP domain-containing protein n=1 Tax=Sporothrix eucalyptigena TaxID=1812306 RepID=A0ABP0D066_9PEZI
MSLAVIARELPRCPPMPSMESDLAILSAAQYDIGVQLPAMRATRGSKRKLQSSSSTATGPASKIPTTQSTHSSVLSRTTRTTHPTNVPDLLSAVDVLPSIETAMGAPPSKARKPPKRSSTKASSASNPGDQVDVVGSDGDDDDENVEEAEKKRARGRPRIDVKDITAADRRRTQIRLAQRAYRSRKEKAIVSLEKRVNSLKEANEAMSNAFMALHDFAVERGLLDKHPDLAQQLRQTTEVFLEMARQSSADEEMEDNDDDAEHSGNNNSSNNNTVAAEASIAQATEEAKAFKKKQQSITDAVKTFGYQTTTHKNADKNPTAIFNMDGAPAAISAQTVMPPPPASNAMRQAQQVHNQLYGGIVMQQPLVNNSNTFDQTPNLFDNTFGMAMNIVNSMSNSPTGGAPLASFFNGSGSDRMASGNDMSSSNSALSASPVSGQANDFGLSSNPFSFDGQNFPLFPSYPSPTGQETVPTSTSDLGPHLADTHSFIATAAVGSPYAGLGAPSVSIPDISFGLRLRRYAIESAYRLITSTNPPADVFARAFGFCIMFEPVDTIRQRLIRGLETPMSPSKFTRWELPFVTQTPDPADEPAAPSGASTTSSASSSHSTHTSHSSRSVGGNRIPNNSNSDHRGTSVRPVTPRINVTLPGFEGAFYDCEETEMYLQQRGVHIPPNSDSVIVEVDDADFAIDDATTVVSSSGTMNSSASGNTSNTSQSLDGSGAANNGLGMFDYLSPDLISSKTAASARATGDVMDWNATGGVAGTISAAAAASARGNTPNNDDALLSSFMGSNLFSFQAPPQPNVAFPQRRLLTLDVEKFLKELVRRGTCLGQTPGFRASDVNKAFWSATRDASSV